MTSKRRDPMGVWRLFAAVLLLVMPLSGCATFGSGHFAQQQPAQETVTGALPAATQDAVQQPQASKGVTGIIGTVTGIGDIDLNGYRLRFAPDVTVSFKDLRVGPDRLRIGQVIEVAAVGAGGQLQASRIAIRHEVAGPIENIDHQRRIISVFGQRAEIPRGVIHGLRAASPLTLSELVVGDHVDVSGLRRANGVIAASYVQRSSPGATAVIRGRVTSSDPQGFSVNGMRVEAPRDNIGRALVSGQQVTVIGVAVGGRLRARRVVPTPTMPFERRAQYLSVEGYVTRTISGGVAVGGVPFAALPPRARLRAGDRIILDGPVNQAGQFAPGKVREAVARYSYPSEGYRGRVGQVRPVSRQQLLPRQPYPRASTTQTAPGR